MWPDSAEIQTLHVDYMNRHAGSDAGPIYSDGRDRISEIVDLAERL
jgi:hypothetical protein